MWTDLAAQYPNQMGWASALLIKRNVQTHSQLFCSDVTGRGFVACFSIRREHFGYATIRLHIQGKIFPKSTHK